MWPRPLWYLTLAVCVVAALPQTDPSLLSSCCGVLSLNPRNKTRDKEHAGNEVWWLFSFLFRLQVFLFGAEASQMIAFSGAVRRVHTPFKPLLRALKPVVARLSSSPSLSHFFSLHYLMFLTHFLPVIFQHYI